MKRVLKSRMERMELVMKFSKVAFSVLLFISALFSLISCKQEVKDEDPKDSPILKTDLSFDADSALAFVQKQVDFGPRVPNTTSHINCANYLKKTLSGYCDTVMVQATQIKNHRGQNLNIQNIIGIFKPEARKRVLLCAHWDTRPEADKDPKRPKEPSDGANDGGSGVGVLLEVARQLKKLPANVGVDVIFFDAEDGGENNGNSNSWCLGSQYWSKKPHLNGYNAEFGILLDMVGAKDAMFPREGISSERAGWVVDKVWRKAHQLGYQKHFLNLEGGPITDDHLFINLNRGIPTIDIIQRDFASQSGFGEYWHTHDDNMSGIDKATLEAVGKTVIKVVREEKP